MDRRTGYAIGSALAAAVLAAGTLSGCAAGSAGTPGAAAGSGTGNSPVPTLTLPSVQDSGATAATAPANSTTTSAVSGGGGTATLAGVSQCTTADLSPEANIVEDSAAAGHITINITITNTSGHKCTVYGFPGLKLEDKNQNGQPTKVTWNPAVAKTLITLANGQSASSSAQIDKDLPVGSEPLTGPCEPASYYLQITAPNNTSQLVATIGDTGGQGITVCNFGAMNALAFVPGTVGPQE